MRYFVLNLAAAPTYHVSGKAIDDLPSKHLQRTLSDYELFFVTDGELYIKQTEEFCVKAGEVLLQNKGEYQGGTRLSKKTLYWLHFDGEILIAQSEEEAAALCSEREKWIFFAERFPLSDPDRILFMLTQLNHYLFEGDALVKNHLTAALCAELARQYSQTAKTPVADRRFSEVVGYIRHNITSELSPKTLADRFSYHPKYLSYLFKKYTGQTAVGFITAQKISLAKKMLAADNQPVKQIARAVGYSDEYYFMRVFKAYTGMTPKTYRKTFYGCNYT